MEGRIEEETIGLGARAISSEEQVPCAEDEGGRLRTLKLEAKAWEPLRIVLDVVKRLHDRV